MQTTRRVFITCQDIKVKLIRRENDQVNNCNMKLTEKVILTRENDKKKKTAPGKVITDWYYLDRGD